jgi:hypothetical protein
MKVLTTVISAFCFAFFCAISNVNAQALQMCLKNSTGTTKYYAYFDSTSSVESITIPGNANAGEYTAVLCDDLDFSGVTLTLTVSYGSNGRQVLKYVAKVDGKDAGEFTYPEYSTEKGMNTHRRYIFSTK